MQTIKAFLNVNNICVFCKTMIYAYSNSISHERYVIPPAMLYRYDPMMIIYLNDYCSPYHHIKYDSESISFVCYCVYDITDSIVRIYMSNPGSLISDSRYIEIADTRTKCEKVYLKNHNHTVSANCKMLQFDISGDIKFDNPAGIVDLAACVKPNNASIIKSLTGLQRALIYNCHGGHLHIVNESVSAMHVIHKYKYGSYEIDCPNLQILYVTGHLPQKLNAHPECVVHMSSPCKFQDNS